jgi:hypothetical protein
MQVNLGPVDSDQPFLWIGAHDYLHGRFYEPRFYGQDYNTFMESLFAVPFMWMGLPVYVAVPLATHIIFLAPWILTATFFFRNQKKEQALITLAVVLCMPVEYDMMNCLPRGFVTGLFFCGFMVPSLLAPHRLSLIALNTVLAVIGYYVNPNSVVVSAGVLFYLFLRNYDRRKYYLVSALCVLSAWPLHLFFNKFYLDHPDYVVYGLRYKFSFEDFFENLAHLPDSFVHISLFKPGFPYVLLALILLVAILLWQNNRKAFFGYLVSMLIVVSSCLFGKVAEGTTWPFYSFSRMFLGIPIATALFTVFLNPKRVLTIFVVLVTLVFSFIKISHFEKRVAHNLKDEDWFGVHLVELKDVLNALPFYKAKCEEYGVKDLALSNPFWLSTYIAYGGPAIFPDYPRTQENGAERRYYIREEGKNRFVKELMYISCIPDLDKILKTTDFEMVRLDDYGLLYIKNNRLSLDDFLRSVREAEEDAAKQP